MENLSANTLFHFTRSLDTLESILVNEFYPRYCLENWEHFKSDTKEIAIPMVCFCDIPLSQIKNHVKYYGAYSLGLRKEWGIKHKINPVLYVHENSATVEHLSNLLEQVKVESPEKLMESPVVQNYFEFIRYLKAYQGKLWRDEKYSDDIIRFYDEREWRFIPVLKDHKKNILAMEKKMFVNDMYRYAANKLLESKKLSFEPNDIKYIIVEKEKEIFPMIKKIREIKGDKYSMNDLDLLITRIISMEQVKDDF